MNLEFLTKSTVVLPIALTLALLFTTPMDITILKSLLIPLLAILMMISIKNFTYTLPSKHEAFFILELIAINMLALGGAYILLAQFFDVSVREGFYLLALVPVAVNVVPLTKLMNGNIRESLFATSICFVLTIIGGPLLVNVFFSQSISASTFIRILGMVIVVPFIIGVLLHKIEKVTKLEIPAQKYILSLGNALIFYIILASNREQLFDAISSNLPMVLWIVLGFTILKFIGIWLLSMYLKNRLPNDEMIDAILFSSFKNVALAASIGATLISSVAMIPIIIDSTLFVFQIMFVEWLLSRSTKKNKNSLTIGRL